MSLRYLHTIDGCVGDFDGEQIVFAEDRSSWRDEYRVIVPRKTIAQIEQEQCASKEFRLKNKWKIPRYGYVVIGSKPQILAPPND